MHVTQLADDDEFLFGDNIKVETSFPKKAMHNSQDSQSPLQLNRLNMIINTYKS